MALSHKECLDRYRCPAYLWDVKDHFADHVRGENRIGIRPPVGIALGYKNRIPFYFLNLDHPVHCGNPFRFPELDNITGQVLSVDGGMAGA